jgi:hypothetical protein
MKAESRQPSQKIHSILRNTKAACQCSILHWPVTFSQKHHFLFFSIHFTIISHLCLVLRSFLSLQIFYQHLVRISELYYTCYMPSLSLPPACITLIIFGADYNLTKLIIICNSAKVRFVFIQATMKLHNNDIQTLTTKKRNVGCGRLNADTCNQIQL